VPAYKHQNGALLVSRWWGILQQVDFSFSKMPSTEHAEQNNSLYHSSSLLQKYILNKEWERQSWHVCKHVDGAHVQCVTDEGKMLESPCLGLDVGDQAKLAFCVIPETLSFLLESIWARAWYLGQCSLQHLQSQHWWCVTIGTFMVPCICSAGLQVVLVVWAYKLC